MTSEDTGAHDPQDNLDGLIRKCRDGMVAIKEARKDLNEEAKGIREQLKEAGLDTDTFDTNVKIYEMEQELRAKRMTNFQRYYNAMNDGETVDWLGATQEPAAEAEPTPEGPPATKEVLDDLRENGRTAGKNGWGTDKNPHPVDTDAGAAWHDGWLKGQKALTDQQFGARDGGGAEAA